MLCIEYSCSLMILFLNHFLITPITTDSYVPRKFSLDNNVLAMDGQAFFSASEGNFH